MHRSLCSTLSALSLLNPGVAIAADDARVDIEVLVADGLGPTKRSTIEELLPRPFPTRLSPAEIREFARRVKNLGLFDAVDVTVVGRELRVKVSRKATLTPIIDFSSGKTLIDSKLTLGAIEHDIDGRGTHLGGKATYTERGPSFALWLAQHPYGPRRWMNEVEIYYTGSGLRFDGTTAKWQRNRVGGFVELLSPSVYEHRFRYEGKIEIYREGYSSVVGETSTLRPGTYVGTLSELVWDAYAWHDLTPRGLRVSVEFMPGIFLGPTEARHEARAKALGAAQLGRHTAIVASFMSAIVNRGNPNHSLLVGSQAGVRGLADSLYRTERAGTASVELRHAVSLGKRWYLQGVAFSDAARFLPMDQRGASGSWVTAFSTGAGVRVLPTALVDTLLRIDVARLVAPDAGWFYQLGITQYL